MDFLKIRRVGWLLLCLAACRSGTENVRGKSQAHAPVTVETPDISEDAEVDPNQAPVVIDPNGVEPLKLKAEVDQTGLPSGFIDDIFAIHKISGTKTILFGKSKLSWLLDEGKGGILTQLAVDISPPTGTSMFVLENKNFWMLSKSSLSFPSTVPSKDPGQLTLINLAPDVLKDPAIPVRVLFAGPQRMILATDKRANIVLLDGDKARVIALDFPKMGDQPLPILSAGLIEGGDSFWFLSSERLLLLKKTGEGMWRWVVSKFKVDGSGLPQDAETQVAMVINSPDDKAFAYVGRTFELAGGKIFEQNPMKLTFEALDPVFVKDVQPLLRNFCTPCHTGYDEFETAKAKAATFKQMIADGTMPKSMALTAEQAKVLTDYMTKLATP